MALQASYSRIERKITLTHITNLTKKKSINAVIKRRPCIDAKVGLGREFIEQKMTWLMIYIKAPEFPSPTTTYNYNFFQL